MPTVSVIIASYNHEKFVEECIQSVLNQTFQDFEIIITDDGSSDRTVEIIESFSDPRIKLFKHPKNRGAVIATNNCFLHSSGKYIANLSSDDAWYPEKLETQVKFLEQHPETAIVFGKVDWVDESGEIITGENKPYLEVFNVQNRSRFEWSRHFFYKGNALCAPSSLIRRECIPEVGLLNPAFANLPDFDLWVRICLKHNIKILDQKLVRFRKMSDNSNASSDTGENNIRIRFEYGQVLNNYLAIQNPDELLLIFPDADNYGKVTTETIPYFLGRLAIDAGYDFKILWGLKTIFSLLQDKKTAETLERDLSFTYMDFVKLAGKFDVFKTVKLPQTEQAVQLLTLQAAQAAEREKALAAKLKMRENELLEISTSQAWNFAQKLRQIRINLAPPGSRREQITHFFIKGEFKARNGSLQPKTPSKLTKTSSNQAQIYVPLAEKDFDPANTAVKPIAFYLPQFHPIPENDKWWGKGFTEWANVSKAVPNFAGHYQPRQPGDLGFYDLRLPEVQKQQVELAKKYGIYGFCFYYYWFAGKRLLERPIDQFLANPELDLPFCLCWANENWTRRWDGKENDILIEQVHSEAEYIHFIRDISPHFRDPRYIRVDGKPLLLVYRMNLLPDPDKATELWRSECKKMGIGEIYLVAVQSFGITDPRPFGFDAAVEFPPHYLGEALVKRNAVKITNRRFSGQIFDYNIAAHAMMEKKAEEYTVYKTVMPSWDNTARKQNDAHIFINSTPEAYKTWLANTVKYTQQNLPADKRFVFINAWNEWAEGTYLEPDQKYGYAYLQATAEAIALPAKTGVLNSKQEYPSPFGEFEKLNDTAVILHLYYPELWEEIKNYLSALKGKFDLFVTIPRQVDFSEDIILESFPQARFYRCENRGRDVAPFLAVLKAIYAQNYKYICKIHTKKSDHREDGATWRQDMLEKLIGSPKIVGNIKKALDSHPEWAIVAPKGHVVPYTFYWGSNQQNVENLAKRAGIPADNVAFSFAAGSMFWFKPEVFERLVKLDISTEDFDPEQGQVDGTLAHAIERFFGLLATHEGYQIVEASPDKIEIAADPLKPIQYAHARTIDPNESIKGRS